jgi:hypothetical protein
MAKKLQVFHDVPQDAAVHASMCLHNYNHLIFGNTDNTSQASVHDNIMRRFGEEAMFAILMNKQRLISFTTHAI